MSQKQPLPIFRILLDISSCGDSYVAFCHNNLQKKSKNGTAGIYKIQLLKSCSTEILKDRFLFFCVANNSNKAGYKVEFPNCKNSYTIEKGKVPKGNLAENLLERV